MRIESELLTAASQQHRADSSMEPLEYIERGTFRIYGLVNRGAEYRVPIVCVCVCCASVRACVAVLFASACVGASLIFRPWKVNSSFTEPLQSHRPSKVNRVPIYKPHHHKAAPDKAQPPPCPLHKPQDHKATSHTTDKTTKRSYGEHDFVMASMILVVRARRAHIAIWRTLPY